MIPDVEKLTADYLRTAPGIEALGARVVGKTPEKLSTPWIKLVQIDATNAAVSPPERLIEFALQLDCYAGSSGGQPEATLLARTARAALVSMPDASHDGAVVTSVRFSGMIRLPDADFEKARERVVLDVSVWARPA